MKTMMSDTRLEKWANYYRYFYYHEEMTFEHFMKSVDAGTVPQRSGVDWSKVGQHLVREEETA